MLMNLCYKILMKKTFLEKITEYQGICERRVRTQISINVIKNILKDVITVYRDLCVSVANG